MMQVRRVRVRMGQRLVRVRMAVFPHGAFVPVVVVPVNVAVAVFVLHRLVGMQVGVPFRRGEVRAQQHQGSHSG